MALPVRACFTVMSFSKRPLQTRTKATRSRCLGSMLAWSLNTKPLKPSRSGSTRPSLLDRAMGRCAISRKASRKGRTPKLVMAEPKNTGVSSPACTISISSSAPAASSNSISSMARSRSSASTSSRSSGSSKERRCSLACLPRSARVNRTTSRLRRSITPRNCSPLPMGQFTAQGVRPNSDSISSSRVSGSRPGRSILLMKVKIGI